METKLCYIDIETCGFDPEKNGILQIAGIIEVNGQIMDMFDLPVRPFAADEIDHEALKINKVTVPAMNDFPAPADVHYQLTKILSQYIDKYDRQDKFHFLAYNGNFDAGHLRAWFGKVGDKYFGSWFWYPILDIAVIAGHHLKDRRHELVNFQLATVAQFLGIPFEPESLHNAIEDILLTRQIYHKVTETAREEIG